MAKVQTTVTETLVDGVTIKRDFNFQAGQAATKDRKQDFYWDHEGPEPHFNRKEAILKKYPEITKLFGTEPRTVYMSSP